MVALKASLLAGSLASSALAFPTMAERDTSDPNPYQPPGPSDARAPCPGLNTLANHGFIPRDGREVSSQQMQDGFLNGFGMDSSTVTGALGAAFTVCELVTGQDCNGVLPNLTILAEPHTFEHDHSFSRQDYHMAYAQGAITNNFNFNSTIFQTVLDTINGASHVDYSLFNQIRVNRMSNAFTEDLTGWFQKAISVQTIEIGFIFSVMGDFNLPDVDSNPQIRTDWWQYWFANESFPTPLGWHKPTVPRNISFVTSASGAVLAATNIASTPSPVVNAWFSPSPTDAPNPIPTAPDASQPLLALPTDAPYDSPNSVALENLQKRQVRASTTAGAAASRRVEVALAAATTQPVFLNPYVDEISVEQFRAMQAFGQAAQSKVQAAVASAVPS